MGGSINLAVRFESGETISLVGWTNPVPHHLARMEMLEDESICRNFFEQVRDHDIYSKPSGLTGSEYGLILIDYLTKNIIDYNHYTSLFGNFHDFELRRTGDEYFDRRANLLRDAIRYGKTVWSQTYDKGWKKGSAQPEKRVITAEELENIIDRKKNMYEIETEWMIFGIDLSPWTYHCSGEKNGALKVAKSIGFPTTKAEGLNCGPR